jgi:hypothetical protein
MDAREEALLKYPAQGVIVVQYFEGSRFVGEHPEWCNGTTWSGKHHSCYHPHSAFFCRQCGEIWGRAIRQYHAGYNPIPQLPWAMYYRNCPKHGDGLFLELTLSENLLHCSPDLLHREVLLLLHHERNKR